MTQATTAAANTTESLDEFDIGTIGRTGSMEDVVVHRRRLELFTFRQCHFDLKQALGQESEQRKSGLQAGMCQPVRGMTRFRKRATVGAAAVA
jgi:hypothetical protein